MRTLPAVALCSSLLLLAACSASEEPDTNAASSDPASVEPEAPAVQPETDSDRAEILESGFGQDGDYTFVTALVSNTGYVGEFATVVFNVYDQSDALVATEEQVEGFTSETGTTAIGTQVETSGFTVGRVEATLSVSDYGTTSDAVEQLSPVDGVPDADGGWTFELTNATGSDWVELRVGIVCRDAAGAIVGGGSDFPSLVPAGGSYLISDAIWQAASPASCVAYPQLPLEMS